MCFFPSFRNGCLVLASQILAAMAVAAAEYAPVTLRIEGLRDVSGTLHISVYDSEEDWLGDDTVLLRTVEIDEARDGETVTVRLELAPGEYALSIYYDRNGNGVLDTNFLGIPREPVASSNNARPRFGPPRYEDAVFRVGAEGVLQRIHMTDI